MREGSYSISWPVSEYSRAEQLSMTNDNGRTIIWNREAAESQQPPPEAAKIVIGIVTASSAEQLTLVTDRVMSSYVPEGTPMTLAITPATQIVPLYGSTAGSQPQVGNEVTATYSGAPEKGVASEIRVLSQTATNYRPIEPRQTSCPW